MGGLQLREREGSACSPLRAGVERGPFRINRNAAIA